MILRVVVFFHLPHFYEFCVWISGNTPGFSVEFRDRSPANLAAHAHVDAALAFSVEFRDRSPANSVRARVAVRGPSPGLAAF